MKDDILSLEEKAHYIHNSNKIENIHLSYGTTLELLKNPEAYEPKTIFHILDVGNFPVETITDHEKALDFVLVLPRDEPVACNMIKRIHYLLMKNLYAGMKSEPGEYRKRQVYVGPLKITKKYRHYYLAPDAKKVPGYMNNLENMIKGLETKEQISEEDCWLIHNEFETIHPFADGNGRTGRLLLNLLFLRYNHPFHTVLFEERKEYYDKIRKHEEKRKIGKTVKIRIPTEEERMIELMESFKPFEPK